MAEFASTLKVGAPDDEGVALGPIQNAMQYERVKQFFDDTKKNNYKFAVGKAEVAAGKGFYIQPTIVDNPPNGSMIIEEEPFGEFLFIPTFPIPFA